MARTLKQQVRKVIKEHYGDALVNYARLAGNEKLLDIFVSALAHAIKPYGVRSPSYDCVCKLIWFDGHPTPIDIELGKRIRALRIQSLMSIKALAARMGVHPDYLDELEKGKLTPSDDTRDIVARVLEVPYARGYLSQDLDEATETEAWIRYTIAMYFGRSLWAFHPEVSYEESVTPFVHALMGLDKSGQQPTLPEPTMPSLGDIIYSTEKKRKFVGKLASTRSHSLV